MKIIDYFDVFDAIRATNVLDYRYPQHFGLLGEIASDANIMFSNSPISNLNYFVINWFKDYHATAFALALDCGLLDSPSYF